MPKLAALVRKGSGISRYPKAWSDWAWDEENSRYYRAREISRGLLFASYWERENKLISLGEYQYEYNTAKQSSSKNTNTDASLDAEYTTTERPSFNNPSSAEIDLEQELSLSHTIMANVTTSRSDTTAESFDLSEYLPTV